MLGIQGRWALAGAVVAALAVTGLAHATRDRGIDVRAGGEATVPSDLPDIESRVEWAADGRHLLVLETGLDTSQAETLYVLRPDGTDAIAPRGGTWARWGADAQTIYCVCALHPGDGNWGWQTVDTDTGVGTPLLPERAMRPSVSPDGRFLAFDDGEDTPAVHVLELTPGRLPGQVTSGAIAPLWLDGGHLAVTDTRPCSDDLDACIAGGHGSMFEPAGTASAVNVTSGERTTIAPLSTDNADVAWSSKQRPR